MKTINVNETTGAALDWLVAKCEGLKVDALSGLSVQSSASWHMYSTDWGQGGPIIEREKLGLSQITRESGELVWVASAFMVKRWGYGPTPLIAAMRCYVVYNLGETVEVPEELL